VPAETLPATLFELAQQYFVDFLREFAAYGILADPRMELRAGNGMLCYYDLQDGHIYLALPDPNDPVGRLQLLFLRSLLHTTSQDELLNFLRLFIPHLIAHELAHHFRHRYGLFTANLWHEEQVANQLAVAVTKHRLAPWKAWPRNCRRTTSPPIRITISFMRLTLLVKLAMRR
jgi:hypothetical protein